MGAGPSSKEEQPKIFTFELVYKSLSTCQCKSLKLLKTADRHQKSGNFGECDVHLLKFLSQETQPLIAEYGSDKIIFKENLNSILMGATVYKIKNKSLKHEIWQQQGHVKRCVICFEESRRLDSFLEILRRNLRQLKLEHDLGDDITYTRILIVVQRETQTVTNDNTLARGDSTGIQKEKSFYVLDEDIRKRYVETTPTEEDKFENVETNQVQATKKPKPTPRISKLRSKEKIPAPSTSDSDSETEVYSVHVDLRIPVPKQEAIEDEPPSIDEIRFCTELLQTSINSRDKTSVHELINNLVDYGAKVHVEAELVSTHDTAPFRLRVNIEDKQTTGKPAKLKVRCRDTILDLKNKMFIKYEIRRELQHWVFESLCLKDSDTLEDLGITEDGFSIFLYLTKPKQQLHDTPDPPVKPNADEVKITKVGESTSPKHAGPQSKKLSVSSKDNPESVSHNRGNEPPNVRARVSVSNEMSCRQKKEEKWTCTHCEKKNNRGPECDMCGETRGASEDVIESSVNQIPVEEIQEGWNCAECTYINLPTRPGCEICGCARPKSYQLPERYIMTRNEQRRSDLESDADRQFEQAEVDRIMEEEETKQANYQVIMEKANQSLIFNTNTFECLICFDEVEVGQGVILRECLHEFCRDCLSGTVKNNEEAEIKCPYQDDMYACGSNILDCEVKELVEPDVFNKYLAKRLAVAEAQEPNSFHCKSVNCTGWCIYDDNVNFFACPVCKKNNCLTCKVIHEGMDCKEYQDKLQEDEDRDQAAKQSLEYLDELLRIGEAMHCPQCRIVVQKKEGCDWIQCSVCKTEICWATKGPRWGPKGRGDTSGGCKCEYTKPCTVTCRNCH